jgi:large subunit ribosomal protein L23
MDIYKVIKEPHSFKADRRANKVEIRQAVETIFKAKVLSVKTMNVKGKKRRMGRTTGKRPDWKKVIVTLAPGENIEFFEGM